jgi:ATP-dependent helicase/nuclease subunit B
MNPLAQPTPRWFTIQPHRPFLLDLAEGLIAALQTPQALADAVVLVPSRRAARGLAQAFLAAGGGRALLLPQIRALGDLDEGEPPFEPGELALELPPAISPWRRRFELAKLVAANADVIGRSLDAAGALDLADALARFLDGVELDEAGALRAVADWVEADLARHWQISARFLSIALEAWPARLEELGLVDVMTRRVRLTRALAELWARDPPAVPLIAAGSTGSTPATAALITAIADAPQGCVVLPGLDLDLDERAWAAVGDQHPQAAMKRMLDAAGVARDAIRLWSEPQAGDARGRWRRRLISEALKPPQATDDWRRKIEDLRKEGDADGVDAIVEGLAGVSLVAGRNEEDAADIAALALREVLETPGRTAALVTPDQGLARRVSARLERWGVLVDSSAGASLAGTPVGQLAALTARAAADPLDPVLQLALLKHPLVGLGAGVEVLERVALRGARPPDWATIEVRLADSRWDVGEARALGGRLRAILEAAAAPFAAGGAATEDAARALAAAMESLADKPEALWAGAAGEAAAGLVAALIGESGGLPPVRARQFADLVEDLLEGETVRAGAATHPRVQILGVLEGRLIHADRLILAGLEEGVWPQVPSADPFLSRPMREAEGLSSPERRIGLSAHDFAQAAGAADLILLTTARRGGAPTTPSRWVWRLKTLVEGAELKMPGRPELAAWARALDVSGAPDPAKRPEPKPPVAARPRELPVTAIERWVRDPYSVYARYILRLRPLERPAEPIEARARGTAAHRAFERFATEADGLGAAAAEAMFAELVVEELTRAGMPGGALARERALARLAAPDAVRLDRSRREGAELWLERNGRLEIETGGGPFTLTARADRIEARGVMADLLDFKTGSAPTAAQMKSGLSPQLTLTAAILEGGGFADIGPIAPGQLVYIRILAARQGVRVQVRAEAEESAALAALALEGLGQRVASFDDPNTGYLSWAAPQFINQFEGDYDHLARLWEWFVIGEDGPEGS